MRDSIHDLIEILTATKKQNLKQLCRNTIIMKADFARLIWACTANAVTWHHQATHREFVPEHLNLPTSSLLAANETGEIQLVQKTVSKISALFEARRMLSGHIFFSPDLSNWHLFYFDQRDYLTRNNHWKGGSHIHLINFLWPNWDAQSVWKEFCAGNPQMRGALHIPFQQS
jgi:hypothetical protein